jgi:hypothetical protein
MCGSASAAAADSRPSQSTSRRSWRSFGLLGRVQLPDQELLEAAAAARVSGSLIAQIGSDPFAGSTRVGEVTRFGRQ